MTNVKDGEWKPENYIHCQRTIIQRKNKDTDQGEEKSGKNGDKQ